LTALDIGDGAAIHLRNAAGDWLIDCGPAFRYAKVTLPYLRSRGVNELSGLFLTHGDAQHLGGGMDLLADFRPARVFDTPLKDRSMTRRKLHAQLGSMKMGESFLQSGDTLSFAGTKLSVLFPPAGLVR